MADAERPAAPGFGTGRRSRFIHVQSTSRAVPPGRCVHRLLSKMSTKYTTVLAPEAFEQQRCAIVPITSNPVRCSTSRSIEHAVLASRPAGAVAARTRIEHASRARAFKCSSTHASRVSCHSLHAPASVRARRDHVQMRVRLHTTAPYSPADRGGHSNSRQHRSSRACGLRRCSVYLHGQEENRRQTVRASVRAPAKVRMERASAYVYERACVCVCVRARCVCFGKHF